MTKNALASDRISSFAAPTEEDIAVFEALSDDEKRSLLEAELEKGMSSGISQVAVEDIFARVKARLVRG